MVELTTPRLALRPIRPGDTGVVYERLARDFEVVRHTGTWPWPADRQETTRRCAVGFGAEGGWLVAHDAGRLIGTIGLKDDGDFGYMLARDSWGRGYATEMGQALVDYASASGRWHSLKACVFNDNPASARVLEKLGFVEGAACHGHCAARHGDFPIRTYTRQVTRG